MKIYYECSMVTWSNNHSDWETGWVKASTLEEAVKSIEVYDTLVEECHDNVCHKNGTEYSIFQGMKPQHGLRPEFTRTGVVWVSKKRSLSDYERESLVS